MERWVWYPDTTGCRSDTVFRVMSEDEWQEKLDGDKTKKERERERQDG